MVVKTASIDNRKLEFHIRHKNYETHSGFCHCAFGKNWCVVSHKAFRNKARA